MSSVPAIVGTDRAGVLLWDEDRQGLTNVALAGYTPEEAERLRTLVVRPADWPLLAEVVADPAPRRYAADDAVNEVARELMERSQTAEALYVPVVIRGELFGIITGDRALGSAARPFTGELRQRLAGLADQAATAFDNTRLLEQERETVARLREADRLKSEFLGIVSHELRTPLAVLLGAARTLQWRGDGLGDDVRSELLSSMIRRGDDLNRIVEDLLQASGTINLAVQAVDIAGMCRSAVADASDLAPDRTIRCCADDKIVIVADEGRLRQVVENLLTNAMKYAPKSDIDVTAASCDGEVYIEVADEGPGMTQDEVARAFDPFYQADSSPIRRVGGLGLGLYICRRIVEAHGGRIGIDATPGRGTTVRMALPQVGAPATPAFSSVAPAVPRAPQET